MPIVTISRQYGSGGSEVAELVARGLGWRLYDNDVVEQVAARLGVTAAEVSAREERVPSFVQLISRAMALTVPEVIPASDEMDEGTSEERMVMVTARVIDEAVLSGPAVLVGRGAQCMLATRTDALHVFCYADTEALVRRVAEELGETPVEARRRVDAMNHQRAEYVRRHWNREWRDVANYDLCLNTGRLGVEGAAALVLAAARARLEGTAG